MNKMLSLFVVLSVITLVSGAVLGGLNQATYELAENNILKFKKIPAVADIAESILGAKSPEERTRLEEALLGNKRVVDLHDGRSPMLFFVVEKDGKAHTVALEGYGQGFGGKLGVMVGFDLETDDLAGIGITTMSETPGLGTRVKEAAFRSQFAGLGKDAVLKVKKDGGGLDVVSGATISSRAVAEASRLARETFQKHKAAIQEAASKPAASKPAAPKGGAE